MKLAGVVTLYNPSDTVMANINSYIDSLDVLYVLDNTECPDEKVRQLFTGHEKIKYIAFQDNMGIAYAMNYALKLAQNYDFLLTMDQDSCFDSGVMKSYKSEIAQFEIANPNKVGVYSVNYIPSHDPVVPGHKLIDAAITSGSVIPVQQSIEIGGFDENLFIDEVDSEFCYRSKKHGFVIVEFPFIVLNHTLGHRTDHRIFCHRYSAFNHNWLRKYYMMRNRIYVMKKYPDIRFVYLKNTIKDFIRVIHAESDKANKLRYMFKGIKDGLANNMGRFVK